MQFNKVIGDKVHIYLPSSHIVAHFLPYSKNELSYVFQPDFHTGWWFSKIPKHCINLMEQNNSNLH